VSVGTLMLNYGVMHMAATQDNQPFLSSKVMRHLHAHKWSWNEKILAMGLDGARNQERLCRRDQQQFTAFLYYTVDLPRTSCSKML
jgi:hypothetical protein